jgi:hypothetical protein
LIGRRSAVAAVLAALVVSCSATPPTASDGPGTGVGQPTVQPSPTPPPPLGRMRSVAPLGEGVAAYGNFRGTERGKTQLALLQDPSRDSSLKITVRDWNSDGETFTDSVWLTMASRAFMLIRSKFAVVDVTFDGKDDLVALTDVGENRSGLFVFKSTGAGFSEPEKWWQDDGYGWNRARNVIGGTFAANDRDALVIAYQYDDAQLRLHYFESNGSAFVFGGANGAYDSGPKQFDLASARFVVGHFTRTNGADQIATLYQYPNARMRMHIFDPTARGLVFQRDLYETAEGEYELGRASLGAADVTGDGKDDVLSVYAAADGSIRVHVLDSGSSFRPSNGFAGWATLPGESACAGGMAIVAGDWNGDRKVDVDALAPGLGTQVRSNALRNLGTSFKLTSSTERVQCPRWPLTGEPLNGGVATRRPLYVKIDNNPTARPHYGISKADQVYEWLVEGLTTRLGAVFHSKEPGVIGSVRSARMTDSPIIPSLGGVMVYSGGGPEELMRLHYDDAVARRYIDLRPGYGWGYRVPFRPAPYNYFTTMEALRGAIAAAPDGEQPVHIPSWDFVPTGAEPTAGGFGSAAPATSVTIPYRGGFGVRYQYDAASRVYDRFNNGVREVDGANNEVVKARNVVVILTEVNYTTEWGLDPAGSPKLDMRLVGSGNGIVFRDGLRQDVTWTRPDIFDVFSLKNAAGEVVQLAPGQTWIQIVPSDWAIPSQ